MNDQRLLLLLVYVVVSQFLVGTVVCQSSGDEEMMLFTLSTMLFPSSVLFTSSSTTLAPSSTMASPSSMMTSSSSTMVSSSSTMVSPSSMMASSLSTMVSPSSTMVSPSSMMTSSSSTMVSPSSTMASSSSMMASSSSTMASSSSMMTSSSMMASSSSTMASSSSMMTSSSSMMASSSSMMTSPSSMMTSPSSMMASSSSTIISQSNSQSLVLNATTPPSMVLTSVSSASPSMSSNISSSTASTDVPLVTSRSLMTSIVLSSPSLSMTLYSASSSSSQSVVSSSTRTITSSSTATPTPTDPPANILNFLQDIFEDTTILLVVAVGGPCILILLIVIIVFCCCFCCHQRRKGRYNVEREYHNRSSGDQVSSRRSISNPIPSYKTTLKNLQEERQRMDDFVETELGPDADDDMHYQGHSQVQHSQPYSPLSDVVGTQSLSKLTPFNPSQIISQAKGGISVDEIDEDIPQKDEHVNQRRSTLNNEGRVSPFMHLSDNLSGSRGRISQRSSSDPHTELIGTTTQPSQASQYSHLGLGVLHGGDIVFTNTASLAEDMQSSLGMVGIDKALLLSKDSDLHSYRTASPLLHDTSTDLDDTPVRESSAATLPSQSLKLKNLTSLTSLTSLEPTKLPRSSTPTKADSSSRGNIERSSKKKLNLGSITALSTSSDDHVFTHSDVVTSDLQETPERHRRHTVESSTFKRHPGKSNQSKLGKLTSIEYIRASLRMKLNRIKRSDSNDSTSNKKRPLKSALRKASSANSQNSSPDSTNSSRNNSFVYSNRHAHPYNGFSDVSPQHQHGGNLHFHPPPPVDPYEYPPQMGGPDLYGPYNGMYPPPPGAVYPPRVPDPYMAVALSPPGYAPEPLSPILSVSQFDHPGMYPAHEIGILPQYGMPMSSAGYDESFLPPHYDDDDDDDIPALHSPYRPGDQGGGASQRNVTWDLKPKEIPQRVSPIENLTPSDIDDDL